MSCSEKVKTHIQGAYFNSYMDFQKRYTWEENWESIKLEGCFINILVSRDLWKKKAFATSNCYTSQLWCVARVKTTQIESILSIWLNVSE